MGLFDRKIEDDPYISQCYDSLVKNQKPKDIEITKQQKEIYKQMNEPMIVDESTGEQEEWWTAFYKCPKCNQKYITRASNYCMKCGVKVKFKKDNE